jgi:hypothetical protein
MSPVFSSGPAWMHHPTWVIFIGPASSLVSPTRVSFAVTSHSNALPEMPVISAVSGMGTRAISTPAPAATKVARQAAVRSSLLMLVTC